ncbi:MAG: butyrate kinase [Synergistaceae bacterium]|jgi:butyrate kinase|nr:butyrate kinase [Synergistaceae bacterium]
MIIMALSPYYDHTKAALYDNYDLLWSENQRYTSSDLEMYPSLAEQEEFRSNKLREMLESRKEQISCIGAFVSVGGMLHPLEGGVYQISVEMVDDLLSGKYGESPMNLGAPMALRMSNAAGSRYALVVDPPTVDEMSGIAHMTGLPEIRRKSVFHALSHKAAAAREASKLGRHPSDCSFIICNMDTTISIAAHSKGRVIEVNDIINASGPMSPRQIGDLPPLQLAELCYSGKYSLEELRIRITGAGGFVAHLGTDDFDEIVRRVRFGDRRFQSVFDSFMHQMVKHVGAAAGVLDGKADRIILTGVLASNEYFTGLLSERVKWIAPVVSYPGRDDMPALIDGVMRVMTGLEEVKTYV